MERHSGQNSCLYNRIDVFIHDIDVSITDVHVSIIDVDVSILDSYVSISSIDVDVGCCDIRLLSLSLISKIPVPRTAYRACASKGLGVCHVMRAHSVPKTYVMVT